MNQDLTKGPVTKSMLLFAVPMILGDLLQQCYNIADTLIVGQFLGRDALAAVGSAFTLMTFLTSVILGLCMGSGALFSMRFGQRDEKALCENLCASFFFIALVTVLLNILSFVCLDGLRTFLRVPAEVWGDMRGYLFVIFLGIPAVFLYNFFACYMRAIGNSVIPLGFLAVSAAVNIALDLWFVIGWERGVVGAAEATVIAQYLSGIGIAALSLARFPQVRSIWNFRCLRKSRIREIVSFSTLTCVQQSIMNLGILMVQGLVNSFGGENRCLCLYAGAGFRQRLFHLYRPKLRGKGGRANTRRAKERRVYFYGLLRGHIRPGLCICKTPYGDFCGCGRSRGHSGGGAVSSY